MTEIEPHQTGPDRIWSHLAQSTNRSVSGQITEQEQVLPIGGSSSIVCNPVENLRHTVDAFTARGAFSARFARIEQRQSLHDLEQIMAIIENDQVAGTEQNIEASWMRSRLDFIFQRSNSWKAGIGSLASAK